MGVEPLEDFERLAALEESPARRRKSSGARGAAGRWKKVRLGLSAAALAAVVVVTVRFVLYAPYFQMTSVRLEGGNFVKLGEVQEKFSGDLGKSLLRVPLERRRRQIERIPWVQSASVRRVLPNELTVMVRERTPVAFLRRTQGLALVDQEGAILEIPPEASFRFPVVSGLSEEDPAAVRRAKMRLYGALMKDLDRGGLPARDVISEVDLQDPQDARVVVAEPSAGAVLIHLGQENFLARYMLYVGHIGEWKQKFPNIQSVDLRYERQAVINADPQRDLNSQGPGTKAEGTEKTERTERTEPRNAAPASARAGSEPLRQSRPATGRPAGVRPGVQRIGKMQ